MSDEIAVEQPELTPRTRVASELGPQPVRYTLLLLVQLGGPQSVAADEVLKKRNILAGKGSTLMICDPSALQQIASAATRIDGERCNELTVRKSV